MITSGAFLGQGYDMIYNLTKALCTWENGSASLALTSQVYAYIEPLGLALAMCFCFWEVMDSVTRIGGVQNVTIEIIIMPLIKFVFCYFLIAYGIDIISGLLSASNVFVGWIDNLPNNNMDMSNHDLGSINGTLAKLVFELLPAMLGILFQIIAGILIGVQLITIRIEMIVKCMFLPAAVGTIPNGGLNSTGFRYLKGLFANIFTLGAILISVRLTYMVITDVGINAITDLIADFDMSNLGGQIYAMLFSMLFNMFIGPFACIGVVATVKSTLREAFGG